MAKSNNQVTATKKLVKQVQTEARKDLLERWRALKTLGVYNSKATIALKNLTKAREKEIKKRFNEIQQEMRELKRGRSVYPFELISYQTPSGKTKTKYKLRSKFQFVATKKKPVVTQGVLKTGRGYIIRKYHADGKISVNKKGEIIERRRGSVNRRTRYSGDDLLKLIDKWESGKWKWKPGEMVVIYRFGDENHTWLANKDNAMRELARYFKEVVPRMDERTQNAMMRTYLEFWKIKDFERAENEGVENE